MHAASIRTSLGLRRCTGGCFFLIYIERKEMIMKHKMKNNVEVERKSNLIFGYFTKGESLLWSSSIIMIIISFVIFDRMNYLILIDSIIGATSLIFNAKGNPFGQFLMIIFSIIYGMTSYTYAYYGEMITYLGMTAPMAVFALISWLKNPYNGNRSEVKVNRLKKKEIPFMMMLTVMVTVVFFFILQKWNTANIIPGTLSVATSFMAVYLTFRRSAYFALAYAANDVILIVLWMMASMSDLSYLSVMMCFIMFLVNDLYGFINWLKMKERQSA